MGAHTGRCFRSKRRTARRKAAQLARGYNPVVHNFRSSIADRLIGDMFHAAAIGAHIQRLNSQYLKRARAMRITDG